MITQGIFAQPWTPINIGLLTNSSFLFWALINALITGAMANLLYIKGLSTNIDASKAPIVSSVEVIVASLSGVLLFSEGMNIVGVFGIILMLGSIYLMNINPNELKGRELSEEVY